MGSNRRVPDSTDAEAVGWAFDVLRRTSAPTTRREPTACRCGWLDDTAMVPIITLRNELGSLALETSPVRRTCRACTHPITPGTPSVVHRLGRGAGVFNRYHNECVDLT